MHTFTQKSIEIANSFGYLDNLQKIYPVEIQPKRNLSLTIWVNIMTSYKEKNDKLLFENLLKLDKFHFDEYNFIF